MKIVMLYRIFFFFFDDEMIKFGLNKYIKLINKETLK